MSVNTAKYSNKSASASIKTGTGAVYGFIINSHTNGTLKFWDNTAGSGTVIMNTYTFPSGSGMVTFPTGIEFYTGLYATIGGTADVTIIYE